MWLLNFESHAGDTTRRARVLSSPGQYYPRIWRSGGPRTHDYYDKEVISASNAAFNLFRGMEEVFRFVEPRKENMKAFGNEIRQYLILACNEVEAQCKAVLRANKYSQKDTSNKIVKRSWNIRDYFRLAKPMRLSQWPVTLVQYPGLGSFYPFCAWSQRLYKPLPWYAANNSVKHDRDVEFSKANLGNLIDAMGAVFVLSMAQFGQFGRQYFNHSDKTAFGYDWPEFKPEEHYLPPAVQSGVRWHPVNYQF